MKTAKTEAKKTKKMGRPRRSTPAAKIMISVDEQFLRDLDTMCAFSGKNRSALIQDIVWANYETFMDALEDHPEIVAILQKKTRNGVSNSIVASLPREKGGADEG